jgi:pyridoxine kinase
MIIADSRCPDLHLPGFSVSVAISKRKVRKQMKRIATVQDISCVGRCSLTVALPIISAMGVETAVLPTAVLSTHTAFNDFTFRDLTRDIPDILAHWRREGFLFDAIYSGYLGSLQQILLVQELFDSLTAEGAVRFTDPAMADDGELYKGFAADFPKHMASLCAHADVIVPNLTELCLLSGMPYREDYGQDDLRAMLVKLAERGTKYVCLTGASDAPDNLGALCYDREKDSFYSCYNERLPVRYHGTGDIFASTTVGGLMNGLSVQEALKLAVDYTLECLRDTMADPLKRWYGVNFEARIGWLTEELAKRRPAL